MYRAACICVPSLSCLSRLHTRPCISPLPVLNKGNRRAMRIVAGTYEGFCYGWESNPEEPVVGAAAATATTAVPVATTTKKLKPPQSLSMVFGYNVHVGCMKSVAMATSGTRAGQLLVTGGVDERVRIYDLRDRTELGELQQHNGEFCAARSNAATLCCTLHTAVSDICFRRLEGCNMPHATPILKQYSSI